MTVDPTAGGRHLPNSTFVSAHTASVMTLIRIMACMFKVYNVHLTSLFNSSAESSADPAHVGGLGRHRSQRGLRASDGGLGGLCL